MNIRERKGPSQGVIQQSVTRERCLHAPKFEDRTQEEICNKNNAPAEMHGKMAKHVHKFKEKDNATFCSPSEVWSFPAPSSTKPEEQQLVVDSRALIHVLSRKDLNLAELESVRVSRNHTTVITANGEVQTNEVVTVYVYDLDSFVTVQTFRIRMQFCRWENYAKITDIHMSGPGLETTPHQK